MNAARCDYSQQWTTNLADPNPAEHAMCMTPRNGEHAVLNTATRQLEPAHTTTSLRRFGARTDV
jgi:hypothetical protein